MSQNPKHKIRFKSAAVKSMEALRQGQPDIASQIQKKVDTLKQNKFPGDQIKLKGSDTIYRVRVGDYRIVYEVVADQIIVYVIKIENRKDVYKDR